LRQYVRERLQSFFRKHLYSITVFDGGAVERPTVTLRKLMTCSAVLQSALARTDIDSAALIRQVHVCVCVCVCVCACCVSILWPRCLRRRGCACPFPLDWCATHFSLL